MSGTVLDGNGVPVSDAVVEVDYATSAASASTPVSHCPFRPFCWLSTRTKDAGAYTVEFEPQIWPSYELRAPGSLGYVYAFHDEYDLDVQWVPGGPSPAVRNLKLLEPSKIAAGASIDLEVQPTSSLCTDLDVVYAMQNRCEKVVIESGAGTLNVEARTANGSPALLFWYTSGNYGGRVTQPAPGMLSRPVLGGTYILLVGLPEGQPSQRFTVTTSLR